MTDPATPFSLGNDSQQQPATLGPALAEAGLQVQPAQQVPPPQPAPQGFGPRPVEILTGLDLRTHVAAAFYGSEGVGKTLLAATAPNPLFLDTENSTATLADWPEVLGRVKIARRIRWKHATRILERLSDKNDEWADRETIVLDTLDALQASNLEAVLNAGAGNKFLPMEHHYKQSGEMLRRWLVDLRDIEPARHIIVLLHEKEIFTGPDGTGAVLVRPAVTPKAQEVLWRDFDIVGHVRNLRVDNLKDPWENGVQFCNDDVIRAKSRLRHLTPQIRNPNFNHVLEAFYKNRTSQ